MSAVMKTEHPVQIVPATGSDSAALMRIIDKAASDPQFDVAKLEKLLAVRDQWAATEARNAYNEAFARFKAEAVVVLKNRTVTDGPLKGKSYAELFSVVNAVTPLLSKHGLSHAWKVTKDEKDWIEVSCVLKHVAGHAEHVSLGGPPDAGGAKNAIQARASTLTYLERYTLKAICGISEQHDDSDGNQPRNEPEPDPEGKKALMACASLPALEAAWKALTKEQRATLATVKDDCKAMILDAQKRGV